jgi:phosphoglucomutase
MKISKLKKFLIQNVKKGKRNYGAVYELPSGKKIYIANRKTGDIFRSGKASISNAIRENKACWALDEETILALRSMNVGFIGVTVRETNDFYVTNFKNYLNGDIAKVLNYEGRGGALQRYLPLGYFKYVISK